ncbi:amidohydrolase [Limnohabitans sp. Rim11]|uniref:amidohydrolase family protein n=1 Tax=Limnohabitans sp. Rim11 TaxID=1100719 RepID=UPI000A7044C5|nr:amidohydrolase family protein [Limnohabitans sp. Rim11]
MRVTLIDAHHHLWDLKKNLYPWLQEANEPHFFMGNYDALKKNYLWSDYQKDSSDHNVIATVHCEAEWSRDDQVGETRWLTEMHQRIGHPSAIVAHAWFHTDNSEEILTRQAAFPLVKGIRSKPVTAANPNAMQAKLPGSMQDPKWLEGFSRLEKYQLSWDLRVPYWHLAEAAEVAAMFPQTPIVLNHTGFPWDRSAEGLAAWRQAMETIAKCPNVWLKVSEFGLKDKPWNYEDNKAVVLEALSIFGIHRCMFASNFPVASLRIDYNTLVTSVAQMTSGFTPKEQADFFVNNAAKFYRLSANLQTS